MKEVENMAKETQKEKIERLEKSLSNANNIIQQLNNEISDMVDKADESFENSSTYKQMSKQIDSLESQIRAVKDSIEHNRKMYQNELKLNEKLNKEIKRIKEKKYMTPNYENLEIIDKQLQEARNSSDRWHREFFNKDQECKKLKEENQKLKKENEQLRNTNIHKLNNEHKHNERGAGRKNKFTEQQIETIRMYRMQNKTIKEIAEMFECSVGLIHKIINEK